MPKRKTANKNQGVKHAGSNKKNLSSPTICLNMIVKNEAHIIHELLASIKDNIHYWVIVDTGSTDGTQEHILNLMQGYNLEGELYERPWIDFGHNRSEALVLAQDKADYIWVMDADDLLVGNLELSNLSADSYYLKVKDTVSYWRAHILKNGIPFRYEGVLHEVIKCDQSISESKLDGSYYIHSRRLGARNLNPNKYLDDAVILEKQVTNDPTNSRNVFYLAQSYLNAGDNDQAIKWFSRRIELGGWEEEVYYSKYAIGVASQRLDRPWCECLDAYLDGWNYRPTRAECLYQIALTFRVQEKYHLGYLFAKRASQISLPESDILFIRSDLYFWRINDELSVCASWINKKSETFELTSSLLSIRDIPSADLQRIWSNRRMCIDERSSITKVYPTDYAAFTPSPSGDVTVLIDACADFDATFVSLNSLMHCFGLPGQIQRVILNDNGLCTDSKYGLLRSYRFIELTSALPPSQSSFDFIESPELAISTKYLFYMISGHHLFCQSNLYQRLTSYITIETSFTQVCLSALKNDSCIPANFLPTSEISTSPIAHLPEPFAVSNELQFVPSLLDCYALRQLGRSPHIGHGRCQSAQLLIEDYRMHTSDS